MQGTRVAGRYRLHAPLSRSGLGTLWAATDERSGLSVSVRRLTRGLEDDERVARFRASAVAAARLSHPNVAMVLDEGQDDEGPYIVSEWIDGIPLSEWRGHNPEWGFLRPVLAQTCDALGYLHARGMVHLDLRPKHLIVVKHEHGPQVKIVDIGCARVDDGWDDRGVGAKITLKYLGSVRYLAPEVAESPPWAVGPWSDIYSFGLVFWEMLTGSLPDGDLDGVALLLRRAASEAPRLPEGTSPDYDRPMRSLLRRLLAQDPHGRPSAAQTRRTIEAMTADAKWIEPPVRPSRVELPGFEPEAAPSAGFPLLALRDGPLIGRREQLRTAWKALQTTAQTGQSQVVVLSGPTGSGKSHLARMIVEHAALRGTAGSIAVRYAGGPPGNAIARAMEDLLKAGDTNAHGIKERAQKLDLLIGASPVGFDHVLPSLLRPDPTPFARPGNEPEPGLDFEHGDVGERLVGAFRAMIHAAAATQTMVVWLDDLHRAGRAEGHGLVEWLLEQTDVTIFIVATVDSDDPRTVRDDLSRLRHTWLDMPRLNEEALHTFVRTRFTPDAHTEETLVTAIRQNPGQIRALTDFVLTGRLMRTDAGNTLVPGTLLPENDDELYGSLLGALPTGRADTLVPDIIAGLALTRVPLAGGTIRALQSVDRNRPFARALASAERARLMYRRPSGAWHFTSDGLRDWLIGYGQLRAESWHRRWGKALAQLEGKGRGRYGIERAVHAQALGDEKSALSALLEACAWALGPGQQALHRGLTAAEQARRAATDLGDSASRARAERLRADILRQLGNYEEARRSLDAAEATLGHGGSPVERGWCVLSRGWLMLELGQTDRARRCFTDCHTVFDSVSDGGGVLWARLGLARSDSLQGQHGAARAAAREIEAGFLKMGGKRGALAARMLRASAADRARDYALADERYAVLQKTADKRNWMVESTTLRIRRARLLLELARPHDAVALLETAGQVARIADLDRAHRWVDCVRPAALAAAGETEAAAEALKSARLPDARSIKSAAAAINAALRQPSARLDKPLFGALTRWAQKVGGNA